MSAKRTKNTTKALLKEVCTLKYVKRIDLLLSVLKKNMHTHSKQTKTKMYKRMEKIFVGDRYAQTLGCSSRIMDVAHVQIHQDIFIKCVQFLCIIYTLRKLKKIIWICEN